MRLKSKRATLNSEVIVLLVICSIAQITLAQEDNDKKFGDLHKSTNSSISSPNATTKISNSSPSPSDSEDDTPIVLSAGSGSNSGMSFPSWEDIRETFRKFQAQINKLRRTDNQSTPDSTVSIVNLKSDRTNPIPNPNHPYNLFPIGLSDSGNYDFNYNNNRPKFYGGSGHSREKKPSESSNNFNYVYKSPGPNTSADLQQHTTTTIYIICVCLVIMVVGSVLFVCVSKCQDTTPNSNPGGSGSSSSRVNNNSRRTRRSSRPQNASSVTNVGVHTAIPPSIDGGGGPSTSTNLNVDPPDYPKVTYDLPPSYDSLFPNGKL